MTTTGINGTTRKYNRSVSTWQTHEQGMLLELRAPRIMPSVGFEKFYTQRSLDSSLH
jgi:hypothetical protein